MFANDVGVSVCEITGLEVCNYIQLWNLGIIQQVLPSRGLLDDNDN